MAITDEIPKSRLTLTYRTNVSGEQEDVALPFRLLVMGDLSGGTSKDRQVDLDQRAIRSLDGKNLDGVMRDMNMKVSLSVPNKIDPEKSEDMAVEIPVRSMRSFTPAEVAQNVPKIRALLLLKKLLLEVQANIDNRKEFRTMLRTLASDKNAVSAMLAELEGFENFKVPATPSDDAPNGTSAKPAKKAD